jgi:two-component system, OmpR family, response regulator
MRAMLPRTLALVDDDPDYSLYLAQHLRQQGMQVQVFADSNDLLTHVDAYVYDFYVLDLMLPGIDGVQLIKLLRHRSKAGVLVVSGRLADDVFASVVKAGADMYLAKPVRFDQIVLAIEAVHRRSHPTAAASAPWRLHLKAQQLVAPDGAQVALSETDTAVMECLAQAQGAVVPRETLRVRLGYPSEETSTDALNATIFRLRRRIERATPLPVPLQTKSRVGYLFKATLMVV